MSVLPGPDSAAAQGCRPPLSAQPLAPQVAGELAPLFKALGDPVRLRLLSLIASATEVCVCDLTGAFDVTGATISHRLRVLREAGLVRVLPDRQRRIYALDPAPLAELDAWLDPYRALWNDRLDALGRHLDETEA